VMGQAGVFAKHSQSTGLFRSLEATKLRSPEE
jgi:hypothetical protein